ncbi:MAG: EscU/YscU/HrcU family type III secretion system export apparatus switch protein [bacterium]
MDKNKTEEKQKAAALSYDVDNDSSPKVVASGKGYVAERIIELAREHGVPLHQDRSLVELLVKMDLGDNIPYELYQAVAEVLAFIYRIESRAKSGRL